MILPGKKEQLKKVRKKGDESPQTEAAKKGSANQMME